MGGIVNVDKITTTHSAPDAAMEASHGRGQRLQSSEYPGRSRQPSTATAFMITALLLSTIGVFIGDGPAHSEETTTEVAFVMEVTGRVVAFPQGKPTLLDALDIISDRTRLDLQANSELRICHHQTHQLFTLKGPLRASISRNGLTVENGIAVIASAGSCAAPVVSTYQAGFITRGVATRR
jgi:hypothetical protein